MSKIIYSDSGDFDKKNDDLTLSEFLKFVNHKLDDLEKRMSNNTYVNDFSKRDFSNGAMPICIDFYKSRNDEFPLSYSEIIRIINLRLDDLKKQYIKTVSTLAEELINSSIDRIDDESDNLNVLNNIRYSYCEVMFIRDLITIPEERRSYLDSLTDIC